MSRQNVDVVSRMYGAFRNRDFATVFDLVAPDVVLQQTDQVPWGGEYRGLEGVGVFFQRLLTNVTSVVEPDALIDAGDRVVETGRTRGWINATGKQFDLAEAHVWTLRDGKVVRGEFYLDTPGMLRLLPSR